MERVSSIHNGIHKRTNMSAAAFRAQLSLLAPSTLPPSFPPLAKTCARVCVAVKSIKKQHLVEVRSMANPPAAVKVALESICLLLGESTTDWKQIRSIIMRENFIPTIVNFSADDIRLAVGREGVQSTLTNRVFFSFSLCLSLPLYIYPSYIHPPPIPFHHHYLRTPAALPRCVAQR